MIRYGNGNQKPTANITASYNKVLSDKVRKDLNVCIWTTLMFVAI